jgi:magnesium transporter
MVMFSELRRFRVRDQHATEAPLRDLAIDVSAPDFPPVTRLLFRASNGKSELDWRAVKSIDYRHHRIVVEDFGAAEEARGEGSKPLVLLDRDVLDALILELPRRQSMRANDLWLEENDETGRLELRAADVGAWALLRRIGHGWLGRGSDEHLVDWRDVEFLRGDPQAARRGHDYHRRVASLQPSEIAALLDAVPYLHAAELLELIDEDLAADTLEVMRPERQVQVFEELEPDRNLRLLALMAPDHAADLLGRLGPERAQACLEALPTLERQRVIDLLRYPDNTAGGIMTNDIVLLRADLTVRQARRVLRDQLRRPDFVYYVYAVDDLDERHLQGVLTLRDVLVADESQPVSEVMNAAIAMLHPLMPAAAAARRVADQHLAALPVVGNDGKLLGAVTADAALLQIAPPSMSGTEPRIFT